MPGVYCATVGILEVLRTHPLAAAQQRCQTVGRSRFNRRRADRRAGARRYGMEGRGLLRDV